MKKRIMVVDGAAPPWFPQGPPPAAGGGAQIEKLLENTEYEVAAHCENWVMYTGFYVLPGRGVSTFFSAESRAYLPQLPLDKVLHITGEYEAELVVLNPAASTS